MTTRRAPYPHEFLSDVLVPGYQNTYVLGCFARYATIYSQQVRAINLVDSLCRTGQLVKGTTLAVVGGAAAGLTTAVAAALRGATVKVFEKQPVLFPIQRNPGRRYLHPHVYDWPLDELGSGTANLPVMNWQAADAAIVFKHLEDTWESTRRLLGIDPVQFNSELVEVEMKGAKPLLRFGGKGDFAADIAVLAIGFGAEVERADLQRYWQSDPIDTDLTGSTVLISGAGDGALTEVMRLCIQDFHHDEIVAQFAKHQPVAQLLKDLLSVTEHAAIEQVFASVKTRTQFQFGPEVKLRQGIKVILNAPDGYLESSQSSILNRFIVYLLGQDERFRRRGGKLKYPIPALTDVGGRPSFQVELVDGDIVDKVVCHRLLVRHGPEKDLGDPVVPRHWGTLRPIWTACTPLRARWSAKSQGMDATLIPLFAPEDYEVTKPRPVVRPRVAAADDGIKLRCFVVESSSVRQGSVGDFVKDVLEVHADALGRAIETSLEPHEIATDWRNIDDALSDGSSFGAAIAALHSADVAIIDVTHFEAGVMLLLGIRSVVRRGVTLITTQEKVGAQLWSELPFDLKELYPLYIGRDTDDINSPSHPFQWLGVTIANALTQLRTLPQYQDSPAYENVRRLGPSRTYFGRIPAESKILWLCPLAPDYMNSNGIQVQVAVKRAFGLKTPFERITDIVSPQLVSQRLYSSMRRRDLCIVDWTTWSANVFYELGVRLAVNRFSTISLLAGGVEALDATSQPPSGLNIEQRRRLVKLLAPIEYGHDAAPLREIKERHEQVIEHATTPGPIPPAWGDVPFDYVYRLISALIPPQPPSARQEVEQLLRSQASVLIGTGGTTDFSSPVLYADASSAGEEANATGAEMLLAAWFYLSERRGLKELQEDRLDDVAYRDQLKGYLDLGERIVAVLAESKSEQDRELVSTMLSRIDALRRATRKGAGKSNVGS